MSGVTQILGAIERGDPKAAEQLLPLVYDELRKLAAARLAHEKPGQTLQATALVHEAYLRLVGSACRAEPGLQTDADVSARSRPAGGTYSSRGHFFAAAAEAMRRILVESARRKKRIRHGGDLRRVDLDQAAEVSVQPPDDLLDLSEAIDRLEKTDAVAAQILKMRYFTGLSLPEVADALGMSLRTVERNWTFARTWLHRELKGRDGSS
jgi:RNA polymerase sigma factor (sigma-70 family)